MDPEIEKNIEAWVETDDLISAKHAEVALLVGARDELECRITDYVAENAYEDVVVDVRDATIRFSRKKQSPSLSIKFLSEALERYAVDKDPRFDHRAAVEYVRGRLKSNTTEKTVISRTSRRAF